MSKDWTGNHKTSFVTLGASNHTDKDRAENDYYATDPKCLEALLEREREFSPICLGVCLRWWTLSKCPT